MKKILLLGILLVVLAVSACQGIQPTEISSAAPVSATTAPSEPTPIVASVAPPAPSEPVASAAPAASSEPAEPAAAAPATAAVTAEPITVEDLLLRDYVSIYEAYCGTEFQKTAGLSAETLERYLLGWLLENNALDPFAVYNGADVDYYSVSPDDALAFCALFLDDGSWEKERTAPVLSDELRFSVETVAAAKAAIHPDVRLKRYERHNDGGYKLTVQRFVNGREWLPAEYEFAAVTVDGTIPPMLEGKTAVGGTLYRFVSMRNLPLPTRPNGGDAITIRTSGDLLALAKLVNLGDASYQDNIYQLGADLDMSDIPFAPIGSYVSADSRDPAPIGFSTSFDGRGHKISNLTITQNEGSAGLFARIGANGFVTNLILNDCDISSATPPDRKSFPTGGIAGELIGGAISRCTVSGSISGTNDVGGVLGLSDGGANVQESRSDAQVSGTRRVGGLIGNAISGRLIACTATGRVDGVASEHTVPDQIGGFVGLNKGATIDRGIVSVRVRANSARTTVGSFAGESTGTLLGCFYNTDYSRNRQPVGNTESAAPKTIFARELIGMTQKELEDSKAFG